jgi:hypothetical protein
MVYGPVVFQRPGGLVGFYAQPCWNFDEFNEHYPQPVPASVVYTPAGQKPDYKDPQYLQDCDKRDVARYGFMLAESLAPSNIVWDSLDVDDYKTFANVPDELRQSLSHVEHAAVMRLVDEANALDADKLEALSSRFLQLRERSENPNLSHDSGQESSQSGGLASDGV